MKPSERVGSREAPARGASAEVPQNTLFSLEVHGSQAGRRRPPPPGNGDSALGAAEAPEGRGQADWAGRGRLGAGAEARWERREEQRGLQSAAKNCEAGAPPARHPGWTGRKGSPVPRRG